MSSDYTIFESHFGFPVPTGLTDLYADKSLSESLPAGFRFKHVRFVLEIQYLLDLQDPKNYSVEHKRLSFAINTDGFELLVDLGNEDLQILQNEYGDIDRLGLTIKDLLSAERYTL